MYKDKPYTYAASRRVQPLWRRKRFVLGLLLLVLSGLWLFGFFSDGFDRQAAAAKWQWLGTAEPPGAKADWNKRRERVVEAFELSWDSYERYGWGEWPPIFFRLGLPLVFLFPRRKGDYKNGREAGEMGANN